MSQTGVCAQQAGYSSKSWLLPTMFNSPCPGWRPPPWPRRPAAQSAAPPPRLRAQAGGWCMATRISAVLSRARHAARSAGTTTLPPATNRVGCCQVGAAHAPTRAPMQDVNAKPWAPRTRVLAAGVIDSHLAALGAQRQRHGPADAAGRAGHDAHAALHCMEAV